MTRNYTEEEKKDGVDEEQIRDEYKDKIKWWIALSVEQIQGQTRSASLHSNSDL